MVDRIRPLLSSLLTSDRGASLVEYSLLVGLIALVAFAAVALFGQTLGAEYSSIASTMP